MSDAGGWAIWNGCQGVFTTEVYDTKAAADAECAKPQWQRAGCTVVPVRIKVERICDHVMREWRENGRTVGPSIDRRWPDEGR